MKTRIMTFVLAMAAFAAVAAPIVPLAEKVPCAVPDRQDFLSPDRSHLTGWIGSRIDASEQNRLAKIDPARLLEGYRKRPGRQTWDGEHVGKWLHAATLAWVNSGDATLRKNMDLVAEELGRCQAEDGYLGTYLEKDRWTEWDVWAHKYNLIGLITYVRYTGNREPMATCRAMGDLLCLTFGEKADQRDIIKAGQHVGMAPTSVLEPMVLLYRMTGNPHYLEFCKYILRAWEQPNGPKIVSTLLSAKRVDKVGNGKAYEMLSCLNGALEYYRTVGGDRSILDACLNAWQDIVDKRLYLTGTASAGEHFHDDFDLPNTGNVGETCVTVTWLQFNAQLLRLTGEARFAEQLENVVLNQLCGAQRPDGAAWGYYVQMEGKKPYSSNFDGHCCLSSGPRGFALTPTFAVTTDADGAVVNLYDAGKVELALRDGTAVTVATETLYPSNGKVVFHVDPAKQQAFAMKFRVPPWSPKTTFKINGEAVTAKTGADGYWTFERTWKAGDIVEANFTLAARLIVGDHKNKGKVALMNGPLVLAADEALVEGRNLGLVSVASPDLASLAMTPETAPAGFMDWPGAQVFRIKATARKSTETLQAGAPLDARLVPFADAGATGTVYKVWLPLRQASTSGNVLLEGTETRSRPGNLSGSINDDDFSSLVVTFGGIKADEDWYAITLDAPVTIARAVYAHGKTFHDGGWFDASAGKPRIQAQTTKGGAWETLGELKDYRATTATSAAQLETGERFTLKLEAPVKVFALRVIGKPACGDQPPTPFSSCAELQAFGAEQKP